MQLLNCNSREGLLQFHIFYITFSSPGCSSSYRVADSVKTWSENRSANTRKTAYIDNSFGEFSPGAVPSSVITS